MTDRVRSAQWVYWHRGADLWLSTGQMLQTLPTGIWERHVPHVEAGEDRESEVVDGVITGKVKGGFIANVEGLPCFMPSSQIDVRPLKKIIYYKRHEKSKRDKRHRTNDNLIVTSDK